jgi:hypothetical protein
MEQNKTEFFLIVSAKLDHTLFGGLRRGVYLQDKKTLIYVDDSKSQRNKSSFFSMLVHLIAFARLFIPLFQLRTNEKISKESVKGT